jgi:hypothetical protein
MENHDYRLSEIITELELISMDTGLSISNAKDLKIIRKLHDRICEEHEKEVPGVNRVEKQNKLSLYFTMHCYHRLSNSN